MRQELVGLLSGRVEGDRVVDFVFHCEGHFFVAAVDGGAGGVDKVLDACVGDVPRGGGLRGGGLAGEIVGVAAGFEDVVEADQVALDVNVRVVDRVADARLRGKVHNDLGPVCLENAVDQLLVGDAAFDENMPDRGLDRVDHAETVFLELRVVVIVHVVETDHGAAGKLAAQAHDQVGSDEAGGAGDQDGLAVQIDRGFAHVVLLGYRVPLRFCEENVKVHVKVNGTLVSAEQISRVYLVLDIAELVGVKAVGEDDVALCLELIEVVDDKAVVETVAVFERGLVDDDRDALRLDALHDALDGGSAEVV